jgi:hypothetical protein
MVTFEPCDHYQLMVEAFVKAVRAGDTSDFNDSRALTGILSEIISYRD